MFCKSCGNEIPDGAKFCAKCGAHVEQNVGYENVDNNVMAIVGFVLSFFINVAGLVCSIIGYKNSRTSGTGKNFAVAGIIISSVSIGFGLLAFILYFALFFGFLLPNAATFVF